MDLSRSATEIMVPESQATVNLRAAARLPLGFLDPAGSLGRRFGSLGLVVNGFETEIEVSASPSDQVAASGAAERAQIERAASYLHLLRRHSGRREPLQLRLVQVLPAHAGFGSGTQLALAVGRAFARWHGLDVSTPVLAQWLGRGLRSGIGIGGFEHGGLLVDGGPAADGAPAQVLARAPLPAGWRVLVVQDSSQQGLSGADERLAIATLAPLCRALAAEICHEVLMRVLPGAAGAEFAPFAAGISRIQQILGEHFAPAQRGSAFASAAVGRLVEWIAGAGEHVAATGQSSWGPTGFAILSSQAQAEEVLGAARAAGVIAPSLSAHIVSGRNTGASVVDHRPAPRAR